MFAFDAMISADHVGTNIAFPPTWKSHLKLTQLLQNKTDCRFCILL